MGSRTGLDGKATTLPQSRITLRLLGRPTVEVNGVRTAVRGEILERILYALASTMSEPWTHGELAAVVWGKLLPKSWESSLRVHVGRLRTLLGGSGFELINEPGRGYSLQGSPTGLDVARFLNTVTRAGPSGDRSARLQLLDQALALWVDGPEHLDQLDVVRQFADRLLQHYTAVELERYRLLVDLGQFDTVVGELGERVVGEPRDEGIVLPLLEALIGLERWGEAQTLASKTRAALADVGFEPSVRFFAVQRRIFKRRLEGQPRPISPPIDERSTSFHGRRAEIDRALGLVESGRRVVVVEGDSGIGKSRFLEELSRELHARDHVVTTARAFDESAPGGLFRSILRTWSAEELGDEVGLLEATELYLELDASSLRPVLLIDDAHVVDLASAKLLRRLVLATSRRDLAVVLATEPGPWRPYVSELFAEFLIDDVATRIVLSPLTIENTFAIVSERTGQDGPQAWSLATLLHQLTGGVPLILLLALSQPLPTDTTTPMTRSALATPLLMQSFGLSFSETERQVLGTAALLGSAVDPSLIAEVSRCSLAVVVDSLTNAQTLGVVRFVSRHRAHFRNERVRLALPETHSVAWQCETHLRIAAALHRRGTHRTVVSFHLASALSASENGDDVDEILEAVEPGLRDARFDDALRVLEVVREQLHMQPWLFSEARRIRSLLLLGLAADGSLDAATARMYFRDAFRLAEAADDLPSMARLAIAGSASSQSNTGDMEQIGWLLRVGERRDELEPMLRVAVLAELTYVWALAGVTNDVHRLVDELRVLAANIGTDEATAYANHGELMVRVSEADWSGCFALTDNAPSQADVPAEVRASAVFAELGACLATGNSTAVDPLVSRIVRLANQRGRTGDLWVVDIVRSFIAEWRGETDSATAHAVEARRMAQRHGVHGGEQFWQLLLASRALRSGNWGALTVPDHEPEESVLTAALRSAARPTVSSVRVYATMEEELLALWERLRTGPKVLGWLSAVCVGAELAVRTGSAMTADFGSLLLPFSGTIVVLGLLPVATFGPIDRYLAAAFAATDPARSAAFLERSIALAGRAGLVGWDTHLR